MHTTPRRQAKCRCPLYESGQPLAVLIEPLPHPLLHLCNGLSPLCPLARHATTDHGRQPIQITHTLTQALSQHATEPLDVLIRIDGHTRMTTGEHPQQRPRNAKHICPVANPPHHDFWALEMTPSRLGGLGRVARSQTAVGPVDQQHRRTRSGRTTPAGAAARQGGVRQNEQVGRVHVAVIHMKPVGPHHPLAEVEPPAEGKALVGWRAE
mmetsp:Transcript_39730/g.113269  ORF Transcript_39730/g.113269 Transcript_39730/m.113269 type:complete len:210 (-) Transcript_39730:1076-1705(-)